MSKKSIQIQILFLFLLFASCATVRVKSYSKRTERVKNVVLLSTMIGKVKQPLFPLIDAAIFNDKTNSVAKEIIELQQNNIKSFRLNCAKAIKNGLRCNVLFGDSLCALPEYKALINSYSSKNNLLTGNGFFPTITMCDNDLAPFKFDNGKVTSFFRNIENYKSIIADIGSKVDADLFAVSFSELNVINVSSFGIMGTLRLDTYLYLFDKSGNLMTEGHSWSEKCRTSGKQMKDYSNQLLSFSPTILAMIRKIVLSYPVN